MITEYEAVGGRGARSGCRLGITADERGLDTADAGGRESRTRMEYSTSLSSMRHPSERDVKGPTYEPLITAPAPMPAGPTTRLPPAVAPSSIRTRPMISLPASTVPDVLGGGTPECRLPRPGGADGRFQGGFKAFDADVLPWDRAVRGPGRIAERMAAYAEAGVTALSAVISAVDTDLSDRLAVLEQAMAALDTSGAGS